MKNQTKLAATARQTKEHNQGDETTHQGGTNERPIERKNVRGGGLRGKSKPSVPTQQQPRAAAALVDGESSRPESSTQRLAKTGAAHHIDEGHTG